MSDNPSSSLTTPPGASLSGELLLKNFKGSPLLLSVYRAGSWWAIAPIPIAFSTPDLLPTLKVHHQPGPPPQAPDLNFSSSVDISTWILHGHPETHKGKSELSTPSSTCSSSHGPYSQGNRPIPTASHWEATGPPLFASAATHSSVCPKPITSLCHLRPSSP